MKGRKDNTDYRNRGGQRNRPNPNKDRQIPDKSVHEASTMLRRSIKGRKDNTDDRKRQGQHKRTNTNMARHGQDKTNIIFQHCG